MERNFINQQFLNETRCVHMLTMYLQIYFNFKAYMPFSLFLTTSPRTYFVYVFLYFYKIFVHAILFYLQNSASGVTIRLSYEILTCQ